MKAITTSDKERLELLIAILKRFNCWKLEYKQAMSLMFDVVYWTGAKRQFDKTRKLVRSWR